MTAATAPDSRPHEPGPGVDHCLARLRRLGFRGGRALAVGTGARPWAEALARLFDRAELAPPLKLGRSEGWLTGSVPVAGDTLPFPDGSFDAVVVEAIDPPHPTAGLLREVFRVLAPGGRAYVRLTADGWSRRLAAEGADHGYLGLYETAWRRAHEAGVTTRLLEKFGARPGRRQSVRRLGARLAPPLTLLATLDAGRVLLATVRSLGDGRLVSRLRDDVRRLIGGENIFAPFTGRDDLLPDEFAGMARPAGFADMQWAAEGGLVTDWLTEAPDPQYPGYYEGTLAVWECLLTRPEPVEPPVDPRRHLDAARAAARTPVYLEPCSRPVISNRSLEAYPRPLLQYAAAAAERAGGESYLRRLGAVLVEGAPSDQEAAGRLIRFVQGAVFRDPVSQPTGEDGGLPDPATILFTARGRCGHCARLIVALARGVGLAARVTQLPHHVIAELRVDGRWVIAEADAYKHGVIPVNRAGEWISLDDLRADPYQLDRFPDTGWYIRPGSRYTRGAGGSPVTGYVDACEPERRGFVSGYYVPAAVGYPPTLPADLHWTLDEDRFRLEWSPSRVGSGRVAGYRVYVSTRSRMWTYDDLESDTVAAPLPGDVLATHTAACRVEGSIPAGARHLFASVVALSDRVDIEPDTHFRPSEESACPVGDARRGSGTASRLARTAT